VFGVIVLPEAGIRSPNPGVSTMVLPVTVKPEAAPRPRMSIPYPPYPPVIVFDCTKELLAEPVSTMPTPIGPADILLLLMAFEHR